jgi:hypothetical protein
MIPGDHLQLHYFYWIFSDMLSGGTPFWYNLYEFNTGDDSERYQVGNYNMPISFMYFVAQKIGGAAFGWNATIFLTLWGTLYGTWLLVRRYTLENRVSLMASLLSVAFPYLWITLLGGSPTGIAMLWVPFLFLGLDMAGRDDSVKGGILASLALMMTYWNDPHTFFFSVLFIPIGYLAGFLRRANYPGTDSAAWGRVIRGALPVALVTLGLVGAGMLAKQNTFDGTNMADGREIHEVLLFTPRSRGLLARNSNQTDEKIFMGVLQLTLFALHFVFFLIHWIRHRKGVALNRILLMILIYASITGTILLAMGPLGPFDAILFRAARRLLPGYSMIRQTAKVFALMPVLVCLVFALIARDVLTFSKKFISLGAAGFLFGAVILAVAFEYRSVIHPTVSLLSTSQPAYEAVALDAAIDPLIEHPHALILPIWPGDSHWASLYQHYVSLYRIRMLNGYSPIVSETYKEEIFGRFYTGSGGKLRDDQLNELMDRGVHYVIFHQNAYPERISAYPVVFALRRLLVHSRLNLLKQSGSVFAFRILPEEEARPAVSDLPDGPYFPSLLWNAPNGILEDGELRSDSSAYGGTYAHMPRGASFRPRHDFNHMFAPTPHLWIRTRGRGVFGILRTADEIEALKYEVDSPDWAWIQVPLPQHREDMRLTIRTEEGMLDLDMFTQIGGKWTLPEPGGSILLPGALFFHGGYMNIETAAVTLRPEYESGSVVFFGPRLPFRAGTYAVTLHAQSDAPPDTVLGSFILSDGNRRFGPVEVVQGREAVLEFRHEWNLPLTLEFTFSRSAQIAIEGVEFHFKEPLHP